MSTDDHLLSDGVETEQEDYTAYANVSDSEGYEDVANIVLRTKRRIRERKAQLQAEVQKAYEEDQQRRKAKEEAHQARLERLDKYRQLQQRVAHSRSARSKSNRAKELPQDEQGSLSEPVAPPMPPPRQGGAVAKESPLKLRLKRKAEARRNELERWMEDHAEERARLDAESKKKGEEAVAIAKLRLVEKRRLEKERQQALETEESEREQELRQRQEIARQEGIRRAKGRLRSNAVQQQREEDKRAERLRIEIQQKREREAAEAALLPRIRKSAGARAKQRFLQEKEAKDRRQMEKIAQRKAKDEKMKQYKNPQAIAQVILKEELVKNQGLLADEIVQFVVGDAVASVSTTDECSAEEFDVQFEEMEDSEYREDCEGAPSSMPLHRMVSDSAFVTEAALDVA